VTRSSRRWGYLSGSLRQGRVGIGHAAIAGEALAIGHDRHVVHVGPEPVVEIAFIEIRRSPVYPGGLALRFARGEALSDGQTAAEADTIDTVRAMAGPTDG
jgi:ATP-dependent DNA ligase